MVDEGTTVGLRVFGSEAEQDASHARGLRRLLVLTLPSPAKAVADGLSNADKLGLAGSPYGSVTELLEDCVVAAVDVLVARHGPAWDESAFDVLAGAVRAGLEETTRLVVHDVVRALAAWREVDKLLSGSADMTMLPALADMKAQVGRLVHRGFVSDVGAEQLRHLPRYLGAVRTRRERLGSALGKDRLLMDQVAQLQAAYLHRLEALPEGRPPSAGLVTVRWMLEEFRVSLWDQSRGTARPVSGTRIRKALDAL
jgi:ATP-dependent helicase HrpA